MIVSPETKPRYTAIRKDRKSYLPQWGKLSGKQKAKVEFYVQAIMCLEENLSGAVYKERRKP